ncbi:hypothetical protein BU15DRAFT_91144 [Melanogaster broomeanus]|nr:hypothetical protein BU15DRAFT_91144 [Melanogaster broomeanus]
MDPDRRWGWFVDIAVERFNRWCLSLSELRASNLAQTLPPVDVVGWHAYLLNPMYAEDTTRISILASLLPHTEYLFTHLGSPDILSWVNRTKTPYDPLEAAAVLAYKDVQWPTLRALDTSHFMISCPSCGETIKKETLPAHLIFITISGFISQIPAGPLHTPYDKTTFIAHRWSKKRVTTVQTSPSLHLQRHVQLITTFFSPRDPTYPMPHQVLRQASFVHKMAELGWTEPSFFSSEEDIFLDLMADSPGSFFVPTLDIDLAWHTHQLTANHYHLDCKALVGRYVDHDDKVEENYLATTFDITCRAWKDRFGLPYTYCGCPLPGTTLGQKLRRALAEGVVLAVEEGGHVEAGWRGGGCGGGGGGGGCGEAEEEEEADVEAAGRVKVHATSNVNYDS